MAQVEKTKSLDQTPAPGLSLGGNENEKAVLVARVVVNPFVKQIMIEDYRTEDDSALYIFDYSELYMQKKRDKYDRVVYHITVKTPSGVRRYIADEFRDFEYMLRDMIYCNCGE